MGKRFAAIFVLFIFIIALSLYTVLFHPWISTTDCLRDPDEYDGKLVTHFSESMIGEIYDNGFLLHQLNTPPIRVFADTTGLILNKYIGMRAIFHKEGYLEAVSLRVSRNRRYKIGLSVIPVLFIGILLIRTYRINWKSVQVELRKHA